MFFGKELTNLDVEKIVESQSVVLGLDIGSKTLGVAVSDRRLMIATGVITPVLPTLNSTSRSSTSSRQAMPILRL